MLKRRNGGGSGIRTHDTVSRIHTFQACAFNHSATPPYAPLRAEHSDEWLGEQYGDGAQIDIYRCFSSDYRQNAIAFSEMIFAGRWGR